MFRENQKIGQYELIKRLGRGGFGEVWLAEKHTQFVSKKVAVKLPLDEQVNLDAIRQEATLWEQASGHANVLPIIDADIYDGQVVIVSEYADGGSLDDKIKNDKDFSLTQIIETVIGILNGLNYLHSKKIIHRDIKPANILLQGDTPRLADFGVSRVMNTTIVSRTITGTDAYMSPEAFEGNRNIQTDIWSVGVILYQLLKGDLPFPQHHPTERMFAILTKEFEPLSNEIPLDLRETVNKSLAKSPENRYQSALEMRSDLQNVLLHINNSNFAANNTLNKSVVFNTKRESLPDVTQKFEPTQTNNILPTQENIQPISQTNNTNTIPPTEIIDNLSVQTKISDVKFKNIQPQAKAFAETLPDSEKKSAFPVRLAVVGSLGIFVLLCLAGVLILFSFGGSNNLQANSSNTVSAANLKNSNSNAAANTESNNSAINAADNDLMADCKNIKNDDLAKADECANRAIDNLGDDFTADELVEAMNYKGHYFAPNNYKLSPQNMDFLQKAAKKIKQLPSDKVITVYTISGFNGKEAELGELRVTAIGDALIKFGAKTKSINTSGVSEIDPDNPYYQISFQADDSTEK